MRPENSHPFLADRIAMAHNGSIKPIGPLDELLDPEIAATICSGTTDSERYFGTDPPAPRTRRRIWPRRSVVP